ncbi:MAG: metallophosphoesterase family protein [Chloroflexi bacterium]|nr:metallophosphoesterase family protein [Chloroflexota bacterium]
MNWKTEDSTWGVVLYATEDHLARHGGYQGFAVSPTLRQLHQVRLTGLQPAETYRYRIWALGSQASADGLPSQAVGSVEEWLGEHGASGPDGRFSTLGADSFTFVVYGDSQEQYPWFTQMERHKLVADRIAQEDDLAFVVHLGDLTYDADYAEGWKLFFAAGREMLARSAIYTALGNHENNSPAYTELFGLPHSYGFRSGEARFLVLDTNSWADFDAQRAWLQDELSSPAKWTFVFYHHPAYSSDARNYGGWELSRKHWEDVFWGGGVTAVFSGHVHAYERYLVRGLNYLVVGTGGGALADLSPEIPAGIQNRLAKTLGYAKVTVKGDSATVEFVRVARASDDNREVVEVYPLGSVFERVTLEPSEGRRLLPIPEGNLKVSPVSLQMEVDRGGSHRFDVRITSSHDAQIHVGAEGLPFEVRPATLEIRGADQGQRFQLELLGNEAIPNGEYVGKLTFLRDAGDNVALGVKVKTTVLQTGAAAKGLGPAWEDNRYLILAVIALAAANIGGYVAYRRYKARITRAKDDG